MPRLALFIACMLPVAPNVARADTDPPVITFQPCEAYQKGRAFTVFASITDASPIFDPKLVYRTRGDSAWKSTPFAPEADGLWKASVGARELRNTLEYFIEAFDENGNGPARVGSPEDPLEARMQRRASECTAPEPLTPAVPLTALEPPDLELSTIEAEPQPPPTRANALTQPVPPPAERDACERLDRPFYCKAWFWVALSSVAAVGAGTAAFLILRDTSEPAPVYPDRVTLVVTGPSPVNAGLWAGPR